ncbi:MAG: alpha/beta hydrolase [Planctomycetota bacterium]|nr:alpha/beta hydrolase [Planctomycetota bacterium]
MSVLSLASVWRWSRLVLLTLLGAYLLLGLLAWFFQRRLIYFPAPGPVSLPEGSAWAPLREVRIRTADGVTLEAWYLPGERPGTVLWLHGNAGDRGDRVSALDALRQRGWGVLLPDYRGYGGSEGSPSEEGLYADAEACAAWIEAEAPGPVVYVGSSVGSGVAVELAVHRPPAGLILLSPFTSLTDVAQHHYGWLPVRPFVRDRYENVDKIAQVRAPLLVIHGDRDRIVPQTFGRRLFEAANEPKTFVDVPGAGHNDLSLVAPTRYWGAIDGFLREHLVQR